MTDRSKPQLVLHTHCGGHIFAFEEYWTEDNDGFCSTDFLWEKHTRLKIFADISAMRSPGRFCDAENEISNSIEKTAPAEEAEKICLQGQIPVKIFDFDSGQREKEILADHNVVTITYWPSYQTRRQLRLQAETLEILEDQTEHGL